MNPEMAFLATAISSMLWMLGGTYNKLYRRAGIPTLLTLTAIYFLGWSWWWVLLFISYFASTTTPFTLRGDDLDDHWFNWVWIFIAGLLLGLPILIVGIVYSKILLSCILALIPMVAQGFVGTLSNLDDTVEFFPWKLCEAVIGFSVAIPLALMINIIR